MYDSINNDNFDSVSDYTDRVSGAVGNDYERDDKDNDDVPYDKIMMIRPMKMKMSKCPINMPMIMRWP